VVLSELGGHLSGKTYAKPLPDQSQAQKHRPDEMKADIQTLPDDVPARLEHGCLLLQIGNLTGTLAVLLLVPGSAWPQEVALAAAHHRFQAVAPRTPQELHEFFKQTGRRLPLVSAHRGGPLRRSPKVCSA